MVDGRDGDVLVGRLWYVWLGLGVSEGVRDSWVLSSWDSGFFRFFRFFYFCWIAEFFLFSYLFGGSGVLSHGAGFGLGFPWFTSNWDFRYIMIWYTIFFHVFMD